MKTTDLIKNLECIENARNGQDCQFNRLVADKLTSYRAILLDFAHKTDPVKDSNVPDEHGCKRCSLCGSVGIKNRENIQHNPKCPWIRALLLFREEDK